MTLLAFLAVCLATAYVCSCVKEDEPAALAWATLRLTAFLALGIGAFAAVIQVFTTLAG